MKIESGKYYKTRDGRKAYVVGEVPDQEYHCFVASIDNDCLDYYGEDGSSMGENFERLEDLIAPWPETRVVEGWRPYKENGFIGSDRYEVCPHRTDVGLGIGEKIAKFRHAYEGGKLIDVEILDHE